MEPLLALRSINFLASSSGLLKTSLYFILDAFQALGKTFLIYSVTNQPTFTHLLKLQKSIKGGEKQHLEKYSPLLQLFPLFCVSSHVYELHTHE